MNGMLRWAATLAAVAMVTAVTAGGGMAQGTAVPPGGGAVNPAVLAGSAVRWDEADRAITRSPEVDQALRSFGFTPGRLSRAEEEALRSTYRDLYSGRDVVRDRLNRTQATALVYMALVHGSRDDRWGGVPRRGACDGAVRRIFGLEEHFEMPGRGRPRFLRQEEQSRLLDESREIARQARGCGDFDLADESRALTQLLAERRTERDQVARQVERMKLLVRGVPVR